MFHTSVKLRVCFGMLRTFDRTLLQSPVRIRDDQYVRTHREGGESIFDLTWWCFAVSHSMPISGGHQHCCIYAGGSFCMIRVV